MKKLMMVLFIAMVGVCFADYKTDFKWTLTDSAKIEKGLAEATQAKDITYMYRYSIIKAFIGKDAKNTTYEEMKSIVFNAVKVKPYYKDLSNQIYLRSIYINLLTLHNDNFKAHRKSFVNDIFEDNANIKINIYYYIYLLKSSASLVGEETIIKALRNIINNPVLTSFTFRNVQDIVSVYQKLRISIAPADQLKDLQRIKMAFYPKISTSDEWKQLLVKVELMIKSVQ